VSLFIAGLRQHDVKVRALTGLADGPDAAAVRLHDTLRPGQSQAAPATGRAMREEGIEDALNDSRGHATAGVANRDLDPAGRSLLECLFDGDGRPARADRVRNVGFPQDRDASLVGRHRIHRILQHFVEHRADLVAVHKERGPLG